jgi:hypothetical protein
MNVSEDYCTLWKKSRKCKKKDNLASAIFMEFTLHQGHECIPCILLHLHGMSLRTGSGLWTESVCELLRKTSLHIVQAATSSRFGMKLTGGEGSSCG